MSNFEIKTQPQPGLYLLTCPYFVDQRGDFAKLFNSDSFARLPVPFTPAESYVTRSHSGVLRGMHFQVDEASHDKLVYCAVGRALDVVVDVRPQSPYFNRPYAVELSPQSELVLFIPKGYAHGFLALEDQCCMIYHVSTVYSPTHDRGVLWSSIDFKWPSQAPILSMRDAAHPPIFELL